MEITKSLYISTRAEWRRWLAKHHASENEIWLIYYKKNSGKPSIAYEEAVQEALCFGWIDSIVKKIDEEKYTQKFSPRKNDSKWSDTNIRRVKKLMSENKMTEAGMKHITKDLLSRKPDTARASSLQNIPTFIIEAFSADKDVWEYFDSLAPSHKKNYIAWITAAKREETKEKRIAEAILLLKNKQKLGLK